ncbi:stalk domain-containing protein [Marinicrinis sediminis]|uniref:Stalk domain-containing protein n=1 Tax=Marinicrinis sediminis TaxID=1652465 RepID=A0ABW5RAD3_9BACL
MHNNQKWKRKGAVIALSTLIALQTTGPGAEGILRGSLFSATQAEAAAKQPVLQLVEESPITAGAVLKKYVRTFERNGKNVQAEANVVVVDLQNPHVKLDVMTGRQGQLTKTNTVLNMAKETSAVAGMNADFFSFSAEGSPLGPSISNGEVITSPSPVQGLYTFGLTEDRKPVIDQYQFTGTVKAANGTAFPLAGINQTYSWYKNVSGVTEHSHQNKIHLYTSDWGQIDRGNDGATTPTEVLVRNGVIEQISIGKKLEMLVPKDGYILRAAGTAVDYVKTSLQVGQAIQIDYAMKSTNPKNLYDAADFEMLIGGHTLLVEGGKPSAFSRDISSIDGNRSRSGIGYSADRRYVYLVTADHAGDSAGLYVREFQQLMVEMGIEKGMNLDGGGSTTLVSRPLGTFDPKLANTPEFSSQRSVINGIGVYTEAPDGEVSGILIDGSQMLFIGESSQYQYRAYDQYYNPIDTSKTTVQWSQSQPIGSLSGQTFTATKAGTTTISAKAGNAVQTKQIRVIGKQDLASVKLKPASAYVLTEGNAYQVSLEAVTKDGIKKTIPNHLVQWEWIGFDGQTTSNGFKVNTISDNQGVGRVIARYDDFSTMLTLPTGVEKPFLDFDGPTPGISKLVTPSEVNGSVTANGPVGSNPTDALRIDYDFTAGKGTKAVYASFNEDKGVQIDGKPLQLKASIYGDQSYNWVRGEIVDASGKSHYLEFTQNLDWSGWKSAVADLSKLNVTYPIKLKRLYVVNPENGQDSRGLKGTIAFDNLVWMMQGQLPAMQYPKVYVKINQKSLQVDSQQMVLDQAPVVKNGHTLIPIRFIVDALGGQVRWDPKTSKITVIKGEHLLDMWIDNRLMVKNGIATEAPIAPEIMSGRTMVPLRFIAETFGWKVGWDQATKAVTLQ